MKKFLLALGAISLGLLLSGCGSNNNNSTATSSSTESTKEVPTLTIGIMPSIDNVPLILAHEKGFDVKNGVNLDIQTFKSAKDRDAAFQGGTLDGISADLIAVAISRNAGSDLMITGSTYVWFDLITGDDSVKSVADLKGKEVIVSKNTSTEYALAKMLEKAGLTMNDVTITEVPAVPTRVELLKSGKAAAAILPEPFATIAKADGLRTISTTTDVNINPFIMAFPQATIDKKAPEIQAMYKAYNEAVEFIKNNDKSKYIDTFVSAIGFPEDMKDKIVVPNYPPATQAKEEDIKVAFAWAKSAGLLDKEIAPKDVLSNVFFK
ncbi:MAG: ABC transporter substrate-binding protein [Streptococcaceae bacterium]|jgi:NitT/TauT family transport system substrate-binding protein|nr:ABC transporter substrate-binding protein [Streptococcaceae bacterium]